MPDILLIHGAAHGAWCWHRVIPALERLGHTARAIDLPGNGDDPTPAAPVTLDLYAGAILTAPRGVGTLISMLVAGRLVGKLDSRLLVVQQNGLIRMVKNDALLPASFYQVANVDPVGEHGCLGTLQPRKMSARKTKKGTGESHWLFYVACCFFPSVGFQYLATITSAVA